MHRMSHVKLCSLTTYHIFLVEVGEISLENHMLSSSLYALKYKCKLYLEQPWTPPTQDHGHLPHLKP